jgi:transposase
MASEKTITINLEEYHELLSFKTEVGLLKYQLAELQRMIYGSKRERFIAPDPLQMKLFELEDAEMPEKETEEITYTRAKTTGKECKQPLRAELPAHLARVEQTIEPENVPAGAKKIGEAVTEVLEYQPSNIYVLRIVRPKYVVEASDETTRIIIADLPSLPIPKGNAGASMVAHVMVSKFVDHQPYYRQSQILKRQHLYISDSTLGGWSNKAIDTQLLPLWEVKKKELLKTSYLMADETPIPVLSKDKPGATHQGYLWVYYDPVNKMAVFDYQKTRGREGPRSFLKGFKGDLQTDGYSAYDKLGPGITFLACMAHARRKFEHARDNDPERAQKALLMFQELYKTESRARELLPDYEAIKQLRQQESLPILEKLEGFLREEVHRVLPQSAIGKAISYTLNLWPRLKRYTEDGRFCIDNNLIENSIRPVALGRKNYLFAGSHDGAKHAAVIYSFMATCKLHDVNPFEWLTKTLTQLPDCKQSELHKLIPGQK